MTKTIEATIWVLTDDAGDYSTGDTPEEARERYEENVQALNEAGGFRMTKIVLRVPTPELSVIELTATAPELAAATALVI